MNETPNEKININAEEESLDTWYFVLGNRPTRKIEDEPFVGLMEWVDLMIDYKRD